jgi:hypothetical protein
LKTAACKYLLLNIFENNFNMRKQLDECDYSNQDEVAWIACKLLTGCDKTQKIAAVNKFPEAVLQTMQRISLTNEDYEFCQVIKELLSEKEK